jgi:hypothetical protein
MTGTFRKSLSSPLLCALALTIVLAATIDRESLWTDEAFSAFMASHRSFGSLWSTLLGGDSSDLQMWLYYTYLFVWGKIFGLSEIAFRTANIPFGFMFSAALVWTCQRLYNSCLSWIVAGLSPLLWSFSNDARPYFVIVAFGAVCVGALSIYLETSEASEKKWLPWVVLTGLLVGAMFHMLMMLLAAPLCVMMLTFWLSKADTIRWNDWKIPLAVLTPVALAEAIFFLWTFQRGTAYEYAHPDVISMASVVFRFAGLSGYYPNRRYDISLRPYVPTMAAASLAFVLAFVALAMSSRRSPHRLSFRALSLALTLGMAQVFAMGVAIKQQAEVRHTASLLPLLLFLIMAGLSVREGEKWTRTARFSFACLAAVWLLGDLRQIFLPEYRREELRAAVRKVEEVSAGTNAEVAVVADPVAADYYGLAMQGENCFPLVGSCQTGFAKVPWATGVPAVYAGSWTAKQVSNWLADRKRSRRPRVVLISRTRHPMYKNSPWWGELQYLQYSNLYLFHGFYVFVFS